MPLPKDTRRRVGSRFNDISRLMRVARHKMKLRLLNSDAACSISRSAIVDLRRRRIEKLRQKRKRWLHRRVISNWDNSAAADFIEKRRIVQSVNEARKQDLKDKHERKMKLRDELRINRRKARKAAEAGGKGATSPPAGKAKAAAAGGKGKEAAKPATKAAAPAKK